MNRNKIVGLIAAPFTPMTSNGDLNLDIINVYADKLKGDSVKGVFICGTTGEGMLMTNEERMQVAESWVSHQTDGFKVIIHVGTTSARQSKELASHGQQNGAYAIGCMGPMFLKPSRVEELVDFCGEVAAGAPDLPFYYYHIPSVSGVQIPMSEFINKAKNVIPNFAGLKFTDNNLMGLQQCLHIDNGRWDILHGYDELLLAGLSYGAKGAVGSTYNFMAPLYYRIIKNFEERRMEEAKEDQLKSVRVVELLIKYGGAIVSGKALMKTVGVDCGPCRSPLSNLDEAAYNNFIKEIKHIGFYELMNPDSRVVKTDIQ